MGLESEVARTYAPFAGSAWRYLEPMGSAEPRLDSRG
jgi:hypothetical protein